LPLGNNLIDEGNVSKSRTIGNTFNSQGQTLSSVRPNGEKPEFYKISELAQINAGDEQINPLINSHEGDARFETAELHHTPQVDREAQMQTSDRIFETAGRGSRKNEDECPADEKITIPFDVAEVCQDEQIHSRETHVQGGENNERTTDSNKPEEYE